MDKYLTLKKIVTSSDDGTTKYVFFRNSGGAILEFSYINKNDGKDIICVPCQTMCNVGCKFCHATDYVNKIPRQNLLSDEIVDGVDFIYEHLKLINNKRTLLISFMGMGEPVLNMENIVLSMSGIKDKYVDTNVRFAIATSIPKNGVSDYFELVTIIKKLSLPVKMHISLHYTCNETRMKWMPNSLDIKSTISLAEFFKSYTNNPVEIHYALIKNVNDRLCDAVKLSELIMNRNFEVKFLFYNEKQSLDAQSSDIKQYKIFEEILSTNGIRSEYYIPPGMSIGSSCGAFLMDEYLINK